MSPAKIEELFVILRAACARQFRFNPRRITAGMRYVGKEGHGKDMVHVFRDASTHSQIELDSTFATLREKHGEKPHWTEAEKAHYQNTDAEIDARLLKASDRRTFLAGVAAGIGAAGLGVTWMLYRSATRGELARLHRRFDMGQPLALGLLRILGRELVGV